ncbi:MAG: ComF family protein [Kofleriaceae bacterium]
MLNLDVALSSLFVPHCAACDERVAPATPLCPPCVGTLEPVGSACPRCGVAQAGGPANTCATCRTTDWPLESLVAPWQYGGELARSLRRLKFSARPHLARDLAPLFAPFLAAVVEAGAIDVIVPVPLHARRLAARGFNQADALARHARRVAAVRTKVDGLALRRTRATPPQTHLDGAARRANLTGAFIVTHPRRVAGKRVLLLDDVIATGATMGAAARALLVGGAAAVVGFACARADR